MVIFVQSSWHFVYFALWLQLSTFIEAKEMLVFGFLVLLVSSQVYHLCSLLLITNCKALPLTRLMDSLAVGNHRNLDYK
jgi:hypothetical protein